MTELNIKLNPYLQEYFMCRYNGDVECSSKTVIGVVVHEFMKYMPKGAMPVFSKGDSFLNVKVRWTSRKLNVQRNVYLSEVDQLKIYRILNAYFKDNFFTFMDAYILGHGMKTGVINDGIELFCNHNKITLDNMNVELLRKAYYRYRKKSFDGVILSK